MGFMDEIAEKHGIGFTDDGAEEDSVFPDPPECPVCGAVYGHQEDCHDTALSRLAAGSTSGSPAQDEPRRGTVEAAMSILQRRLDAEIARQASLAEYAAQARARRLEIIQSEIDAIASMPEDDFEPGSVIRFDRTFNSGSKVYSYAAIKTSEGLWSTTGPKSPKNYTWVDLLRWLQGETVDGIWWATNLEKL
jgi:hypothetical protein